MRPSEYLPLSASENENYEQLGDQQAEVTLDVSEIQVRLQNKSEIFNNDCDKFVEQNSGLKGLIEPTGESTIVSCCHYTSPSPT